VPIPCREHGGFPGSHTRTHGELHVVRRPFTVIVGIARHPRSASRLATKSVIIADPQLDHLVEVHLGQEIGEVDVRS